MSYINAIMGINAQVQVVATPSGTTASILSHATLAEDIVAYWALNADSSIPDRTNRYDGTNSGADYTTSGPISGAYSFVSSNSDYIDVGNIPIAGASEDFAIAFWIKATASSGTEYIFKQGEESTGRWIGCFSNDGTQLLNFVADDGSTAEIVGDAGSNIRDGTWHHIVFQRSGSTLYTYLDGNATPDDTEAANANSCYEASNMDIGRRSSAANAYFNGDIADYGVWNRALTTDEISDLYAAGNGLPWQPLPFSESSTLHQNLTSYYNSDGQSFTDYWGVNNGTVTNATFTSSGKLDNAFSYDGTSDYVDMGLNSSISIASGESRSVSAWVYYDSGTHSEADTIYTLGWYESSGRSKFFRCSVNTSRQLSFECEGEGQGSGDRAVLTSSTTLNTDEWTHVVFTYDGSTGTPKGYINGTEVSYSAQTSGTANFVISGTNSNGRNYLGAISRERDGYTIIQELQGDLDEVGVWNKVLSSDEVSELYNSNSALRFREPFQGHTTLTTDLQNYWTFRNDGKSDVSAIDMTVTGATYTTDGKMENGYDYDGTNDYLEDSNITLPATYSMSMWIYPDAYDYRRIVNGWDGAAHYPELRFDNNNELYYTDGSSSFVTSGSDIDTSGWHHIILVKTGTTAKIYINGTERGSGTGLENVSNAVTLTLGGDRTHTSTKMFNGKISDFGIWDKELSTDEITDLYNNGIGLRFY